MSEYAEPDVTTPPATRHALLRGYAARMWPSCDADAEAVNLAAEPVHGGEPELVALLDEAYRAGQIAACVHVIAAMTAGGAS